MKHRRSLAVVLFLIAILAAFAGSVRSQIRAAASPLPKPQSVEELRSAVAKVLADNHVPGAGISIVDKGHVIWAGGVGKANLASNRDVDADTMFRIGSITKSFVALSLLKLQEEGKVELSTALRDIAPEVKIVNRWESTDPVRITNLLEHSAGFDDMMLGEIYDTSGAENTPLVSTFERFPEPQVVRWRPGTLQSYSNPGYAVAGYILEKIAGQPCEEYIATNILRPLGMRLSDMRLTPEIKAALAQGYSGNPPKAVTYYPIPLRPAGEMKSSPAEMARFLRMMLNRGAMNGVRIVGADSITRMENSETSLAASAGFKDGYGLGNMARINHPIKTHGHDGGIDGFLSTYAYLPDQGVGYFISINSVNEPAIKAIDDLVFDFTVRGKEIPPKPAEKPIDNRIRAAAGFYQFVTPRNARFGFISELTAQGWTFIESGKLYRSGIVGGRERLIYLGDGQFRTETESGSEGVYFTDRDGNSYGCGAISCYEKMNPVWPITKTVLILVAILTTASSILFSIIWVPRKLIGWMRGVGHLEVRIVPLLASLSFLAIVLLYAIPKMTTFELTQVTPFTVSVFIVTLLFPVLSIAALVLATRSVRYPLNRAVKVHSIAVAIACTGIAAYLGYLGMIAFRFWAA